MIQLGKKSKSSFLMHFSFYQSMFLHLNKQKKDLDINYLLVKTI